MRAAARPGRGRSAIAVSALIVSSAGTIVQARLNAELVHLTGNALEVSLTNLVVGAAISSVLVLLVPALRRSWGVTIAAARTGRLRPWQLAGGAFGGYYIAVQGTASLAFGVAVFTVAVVAGQTSTALVVDRLGLGPMGRQDVTTRRLIAALLAVSAVVLSVTERIGHSETSVGSLIAVLALAVSAGAASAFQQAVNGTVSAIAGRAIVAAWVNFALGGLLMAVAVTLLAAVGRPDVAALPWDQWWLFVAGAFGLIYVATVAWVVRLVGVLVSTLLTLVGLLAGSLILDVAAPTDGTVISWQLLAAVAVTAAAVLLATRGSRT